MPDGILLLETDHRLVEALFATIVDERDPVAAGIAIARVADLLRTHDDVEHSALYPLAATLGLDRELPARSAAAHAAVQDQLQLMAALEGPALLSAVDALQMLVAEHVADEEQRLFPALRAAAEPGMLEDLGSRILRTRQRAG